MSSLSHLQQLRILISIILLLLVSPFPAQSTLIEGIVLSEKGPVTNSHVHAYDEYKNIVKGVPAYTSTSGEKNGFFRLELPPGRYYLAASGEVEGRAYFSFHGANPVTIEDKDLWVPFMVVPRTTERINGAPSTKLSGKVTFKGLPVPNAQVSIYPETSYDFRGMGFSTNTTDSSGLFEFNPEPGGYVIVARKRKDFIGFRPLEKGDLFCYFSGNPVTVEDSKETLIEIPCYPKDDLEAFLNKNVYPSVLVKKSGKESVRFRESKIDNSQYNFKIKGRVTDLRGNSMKDLYVKAYRGKPSRMFQMLDVRLMPEYLVRTDMEGNYEIALNEKGTYYLVARELIGEAPAKGEYYGLYEGNTNHAVFIEEDSVESADIVVSKVMSEETQDPEYRAQNVIQDRIYPGDSVINANTEWSGYIIVNGTVHVARGVTLKIDPGTVVFFRKTDENRDGVGDAKITVSGRLIARGRPDNMIRFTSAEPEPGKMDWSFLLFFVSGDENIVEYCKFEHAFTGVQVHFSKAIISDSIFTRNHEGIRFGRTELQINHNNIYDNSFGIRYTRLEGPVEIAYNNIRDNNVGIFHVPSNQNIVDFSATFKKKQELHRFQPVVRQNNISYNEEYNFRLGERQGYNIRISDNWWGNEPENVIEDLIYDERTDGSIGKVIYKPFFTSPVKDAGVRKER